MTPDPLAVDAQAILSQLSELRLRLRAAVAELGQAREQIASLEAEKAALSVDLDEARGKGRSRAKAG